MTGLELLGHVWLLAALVVIVGSTRATWHDWHSIERACKKRRDEV